MTPTVPSPVIAAIERLERTPARRWNGEEPPGFVCGNVDTRDIGIVLEFLRDLIRRR